MGCVLEDYLQTIGTFLVDVGDGAEVTEITMALGQSINGIYFRGRTRGLCTKILIPAHRHFLGRCGGLNGGLGNYLGSWAERNRGKWNY